MSGARIVIMAKAPVPGAVKTRLIPLLGAEGAAVLAAQMLAATVAEALLAAVGEVELCASPGPGDPCWAAWLPTDIRLSDQGEGGLGERLARVAARVLGEGERVLLIGTDCPALDASRIGGAAAALDTHDAVVFPATDGGYVLLGLKQFDRSLFEDIAWSTDGVAAATMARFKALGWSLFVGETLRDIDEPDDYSAWAGSAAP